MKNISKILTVSAILGFLLLMAVPVSALAAGDGPFPGSFAGKGPRDGGGMTAHLDQLESLGYDVSEIRAAVESGDYETAHTLLQQFMEEHKDELPGPGPGEKTGEGRTFPSRPVSEECPGSGVLKARTALNG